MYGSMKQALLAPGEGQRKRKCTEILLTHELQQGLKREFGSVEKEKN